MAADAKAAAAADAAAAAAATAATDVDAVVVPSLPPSTGRRRRRQTLAPAATANGAPAVDVLPPLPDALVPTTTRRATPVIANDGGAATTDAELFFPDDDALLADVVRGCVPPVGGGVVTPVVAETAGLPTAAVAAAAAPSPSPSSAGRLSPASLPSTTLTTATTRLDPSLVKATESHSGRATDALTAYDREIRTYALLRAEEEAALAVWVQRLVTLERVAADLTAAHPERAAPSMDAWAAAVGVPPADLAAQLRDARHAKDLLVSANLRLVLSIARAAYYAANRGSAGALGGVTLLDVVQEGTLGLIRCAELYDPRVGRFSSYATPWVRAYTRRAVRAGARLVRLPDYVSTVLCAVQAAHRRLYMAHARPPTDAEVAAAVDLPVPKLRSYLALYRAELSLDAPLNRQSLSGGGGGGNRAVNILDVIPNDPSATAATPEAATDAGLLRERVDAALDGTLSPREATLIRLRFGLTGDAPATQPVVGRALSVSVPRVAQLERRALRKLREREPQLRSFAGVLE